MTPSKRMRNANVGLPNRRCRKDGCGVVFKPTSSNNQYCPKHLTAHDYTLDNLLPLAQRPKRTRGRPPKHKPKVTTTATVASQWAFIIPGKPVGKQRPRFSRGKVYTPTETVEYEKLVAVSAMLTKPPPPFARCAVHIAVRIPVRWHRRKREGELLIHEPLKRPDLDNIIKSILDGLQGIAYNTDRDVLSVSARWQFIVNDDKPCVEVMVTKVDWDDYAEGKGYHSI